MAEISFDDAINHKRGVETTHNVTTKMFNAIADVFVIHDPYRMEHVTRRYVALRTAYNVPNGYIDVIAQGYWLKNGIPTQMPDDYNDANAPRIIDMRPGTDMVVILYKGVETRFKAITHKNDLYGVISSVVRIKIRDSWHPEYGRETRLQLGLEQ